MIEIFKRKDISPIIVLIIVTIIVKLHAILHPPSLVSLSTFQHGFCFNWIWLKNSYEHWPRFYIILSIIFQLGFALYFNFVINEERIFPRKNYLPALAFILFSSWLPTFAIISTVFMANFLLFFAFAKALSLYNLPDARRVSFDIGVLIGMACLFYFPAILCVPLFILIILLLRPLSLQELIGFLFGVLVVFYLMAGFIYVFGDLQATVKQLYYHFALPLTISSPNGTLVATIASIAILVYGTFLINQTGEQRSMAVRKKWNAVFFYCVFSIVLGLFSPVFPGFTWILALTPFSILLSQAFQNKREKFNTFTLYFLLVILLLTQWILN